MFSPLQRLFSHQLARYLAVGVWNSLVGFLSYAVFYALLGTRLHYLLVLIPANVVAITNAFFCYKYIVFRSQGNAWAEYAKCWLVYGWMALINAGALYLCVSLLRLHPVLANGLCLVVATGISYFSHKYFSFAAEKAATPSSSQPGRRGPGGRP